MTPDAPIAAQAASAAARASDDPKPAPHAVWRAAARDGADQSQRAVFSLDQNDLEQSGDRDG